MSRVITDISDGFAGGFLGEFDVGNTLTYTWVDSSVSSASSISHAILNGNETLISSKSATSSGGGHYYALDLVNTPGFYISEWKATINSNAYTRRDAFKIIKLETD